MKTAIYTQCDGTAFTIEYDENAPCICCGEPVTEASMGGTVICPWCDCGVRRNGDKWTWDDLDKASQHYQEAMRRSEQAAH